VTVHSESGIPLEINTLAGTDVGLVLTATKLVRDDAPLNREPIGVAGHVSASIDPVQAFQLLVTDQKSVQAASAVANDQEISGAGEDKIKKYASESAVVRIDATSHAVEVGGAPTQQSLELFLGQELNTKNSVAWLPGRQSNGFLLILGASGSGKTETLKVLGKGIVDYGVPVLVLDFHGDVNFPGLRSVLLSSGTSSTTGVNPMELDSQSAEETGLYDQRKVIRDMVRNAVPALGHRQNAILRDAIEEAYQTAGFDDGDPLTWRNTPPTFADVERILSGWSEDDARKSQRSAIEGVWLPYRRSSSTRSSNGRSTFPRTRSCRQMSDSTSVNCLMKFDTSPQKRCCERFSVCFASRGRFRCSRQMTDNVSGYL
jgi:hypothetical protein